MVPMSPLRRRMIKDMTVRRCGRFPRPRADLRLRLSERRMCAVPGTGHFVPQTLYPAGLVAVAGRV